jgi:hypothetical protein
MKSHRCTPVGLAKNFSHAYGSYFPGFIETPIPQKVGSSTEDVQKKAIPHLWDS